MGWREYIELNFPNRSFTEFTAWEIGELDLDVIYPNKMICDSSFLNNIFDDIPYMYLHVWKDGHIHLWQCNYCTFWSDWFDQRLIESHLFKCKNVSQTSTFFSFSNISIVSYL